MPGDLPNEPTIEPTAAPAPAAPTSALADFTDDQIFAAISGDTNSTMLENPSKAAARALAFAGDNTPDPDPQPDEPAPEPTFTGSEPRTYEEALAALREARQIGGRAANEAAELRKQGGAQPAPVEGTTSPTSPPTPATAAGPKNLRELGTQLMPLIMGDPDSGVDGAKEWARIREEESVLVMTPDQFERAAGNLFVTIMAGVAGRIAPLEENLRSAQEAESLAQVGLTTTVKSQLMEKHPWLGQLSGEPLKIALVDLAKGSVELPSRPAPLEPSRPVDRPRGGGVTPIRSGRNSTAARYEEARASGNSKLADSLLDRMIAEEDPLGINRRNG